MRIAIIGYSGAGKSTLAKTLGNLYNCPILYLDHVNFEPGWVERDREEAKKMVAEFMENENWVIDGSYTEFHQEERLRDADKIIFMNFPRFFCLYQAVKRYLTHINKTRESAAPGCIEKIDFEFLCWLLYKGRTKQRRERFENIVKKYPQKVIEIKNRKQLNEFLQIVTRKI